MINCAPWQRFLEIRHARIRYVVIVQVEELKGREPFELRQPRVRHLGTTQVEALHGGEVFDLHQSGIRHLRSSKPQERQNIGCEPSVDGKVFMQAAITTALAAASIGGSLDGSIHHEVTKPRRRKNEFDCRKMRVSSAWRGVRQLQMAIH